MFDQRSDVHATVSWLCREFDPGEQIVAGVLGRAGRMPRWEVPATFLAIASWAVTFGSTIDAIIAGRSASPGLVLAGYAPLAAMMAVAQQRRATYIAVTTRHVYVIRMAGVRQRVPKILFRTSMGAVRATSKPYWIRRELVQFEGPDFHPSGMQFLVNGQWRPDLQKVLAELQPTGDRPRLAQPT